MRNTLERFIMLTPPFEIDQTVEQQCSIGSHNRRQEARIEDCHCCAYEMCEPGENGTVAICQGSLVTVNRSAHGILLMMREPPRLNQLIEVHNTKLGWQRSMMVYQVRWTRPIHIESEDDVFLVGCRLTIGLSPTGDLKDPFRSIGSV